MNDTCIVSVRLMTYNHQAYIADAMDGIMMQQVSFRVEVVVGDDFSSDSTIELIKKYNSTNKICVRILNRERGDEYDRKRKKLGRLYNFTNIIANCTGKYIALLDGDDYWTDPLKLQKQVDFLDANPDCVLCHHWQDIAKVGPNGHYSISSAPRRGHGYYPERIASIEKIFSNELRIKSRTVMFRNVLNDFPTWFYDVAYGDVPLSMILGGYGKFGFIDEIMAVYRQSGKGVSAQGRERPLFVYEHYINWITVWEYGNQYFNSKYIKEVLKTIYSFYTMIFRTYKFGARIFHKMAMYALFESKLPFIRRFRIFLKLFWYFLKGRTKRALME